MRFLTLSLLFIAVCAAAPDPTNAQASRQIKLIVPYAPGGSYDLYARLVATHLTRKLVNHPSINVVHMPGAGGVVGVQTLYAVEPQDGTSLAIMPRDIASNQMLHPSSIQYDARRFGWVGIISSYSGILYVFTRTGITNVSDLKIKPVVIGSWGPATESFTTPTLLNALTGTQMKIVTGYRGGPDVDLAAERGEVDGRVASWIFLKTQRGQWLKDNLVMVPFQTGLHRHPELPNVPLITELATNDADRQILEFLNADSGLGWSIATTPNVSASRLAELRTAFDDMVGDREFRQDAENRGLEVVPGTGAELDKLVERTIGTPQESIAKLKKIIGDEPR